MTFNSILSYPTVVKLMERYLGSDFNEIGIIHIVAISEITSLASFCN